MRARTSDGPPAGNGTTILMERLGKASDASCARADPIGSSNAKISASGRMLMAISSLWYLLIEFQSDVCDHARPPLRLLADETGEFFRRAGHRIAAGLLRLLPQHGIRKDFRDFHGKLVDDRFGCAARGNETEPDRDVVEIRNARGVRQRWNPRHGRRGIAIEPRQCAHHAARDNWRNDRIGGVDQLYASGQKAIERIGRALEGHIHDVEACCAMEEMAHEARRDCASAIIELARMRFWL